MIVPCPPGHRLIAACPSPPLPSPHPTPLHPPSLGPPGLPGVAVCSGGGLSGPGPGQAAEGAWHGGRGLCCGGGGGSARCTPRGRGGERIGCGSISRPGRPVERGAELKSLCGGVGVAGSGRRGACRHACITGHASNGRTQPTTLKALAMALVLTCAHAIITVCICHIVLSAAACPWPQGVALDVVLREPLASWVLE